VSRALAGVLGPSGSHAGEPVVRRALEREGGSCEVVTDRALSLGATATAPSVPAGSPRVLCALAGRMYGLETLEAELGVPGARGPEQVVAAAYERWGSGMLERLRGRFALVLWDRARGAGIAAVDALGAGGLFLHESGGSLRFASELRVLLRLLPSRAGPDREAVESWLAGGVLERGRTLYEGVRRLPGGCCLELGDGTWRESAYWGPRYARPAALARGDAVDAVRAVIDRAVRLRSAADGPTGLLLSGGIDSSSVAAFAAGPADVRAYSLFFPGRPSMDESALVRATAARLSVPLTAVRFSRGSMLAASLDYLRVWEVPSVSPNLVVHRPLLGVAAEDGVKALLDGQGGDELFGVEPYLLADRVRRGRLPAAMRLARRLPWTGERAPRRALWRALREFGLEGALSELGRGETASWKRTPGPRWFAHLADGLTAARERAGAHDFLRHKNGLAGLEGGHPFLDDRDLVELVLRLPPELSFDARLDRPLLREACASRLPDDVRLRRSKSFFDELFSETLDGPDRPAIARLLTPRDAEVNAYVRPEDVRERVLRTPSRGREGAWAWALWRLVAVECWLRFQREPSFPEELLAGEDLLPPQFAVEAG
jgi:asparagine synthase (glutamine-hydrolysing)